jgi:hypothetical protein
MSSDWPSLEIFVGRSPRGWTARAYNTADKKHAWSSEEASSVHQALREIADQIDKREIARCTDSTLVTSE